MKFVSFIAFLQCLLSTYAWSASPVPYSGKVAMDGINFHGNAQFTFALHDGNGTSHWYNGADANQSIQVFVRNGRYSVLLGGQGMNILPPELFLTHDKLYLRVKLDNGDGKGLRHLAPDQLITATPRALVAEWAKVAEVAKVAERLLGDITSDMLSSEILSKLDANQSTLSIGPITLSMLAPEVRSDLNRTITKSMLGSDVLADLNQSIKTVSRDMLPASVLADLNRTITMSMLGSDVLADLNKSVSITRDMLPQDVRDDLNKTVTITRSMLPADVLADLNKSSTTASPITLSMLAPEVTAKLDQNVSGVSGVVAGSIISVPSGQSAPDGYSLYQRGTPKELVWEEKAPVSVARGVFDGADVLNGKIYIVGGENWGSGASYDLTERYDTVTNSWETLNPISVARTGITSTVLGGKFYAIGGVDLSSVEILDPTTNNWATGVSMPSALSYGAAITVNGKIYLIGGINSSNQATNQVLSFDPITNQWVTKANMPTARSQHQLVWFENRIWVIGGHNGGFLNKVESYDPISDTWQNENSLKTPRKLSSAWVAHGRIYICAGYNGAFLTSVEVYDPTTKLWSNFGNFPEGKEAGDAVVLNEKVYVIAGKRNSSTFSNKVFAADLNASVAGVYDLYRKDGNASAGTPLVQAEVADGSVTSSKIANQSITSSKVTKGAIGIYQLNDKVLKYLKPEITTQPQAQSQTVYADSNVSFFVTAEGKYLSYQWKKDGSNLTGETNSTLIITDANATQHDGNYSVVVSNDFGSVESGIVEINIWTVNENVQNLALWLDASNAGSFVLSNTIIQNWKDLSGNGYDMNITDGNASLTGLLNGKIVALYDGDDVTATTKNFSNDLDQSGYSIVALSRYAGGQRFRVISSGYSAGARNWLFGHHGGKHSTFFAENWVDAGTTGDLNWHIFSATHEPAISHNNGVPPLTSFWLDGTNRILNSGLSSDGSPAPSDIVFGGAKYGEKSSCEVAEFIMIASEISDANRHEIEGYLAHKWGLTANLPSDHPYKNIAL